MKKLAIVIGVILLIGLVVGMVMYFKKSGSATSSTTTTQTAETTGLSSLLGKLNLSGLTVFGAGS